ncbi:MAG: AEC family transporter [Lachnospiraceae bacterium]|nr:AEC family transporter [Lachnospiraceae bacterium]MBO7095382.1 AEC family transporter [Lachnospiraceae bacterium]MBO7362568.1 AEC family transporter [Lachnospiraceae bacterium]MBO7531999.1 AEC family transporter [Lachnospiraceae bacterium]MBP5252544.1 AEC family transporter [Lachnospiraceae bacterium]
MGAITVLKQMTMIAVLAAIGFFLQKKKVLDKNSTPVISRIVVDICNPALIVSTILTGNITVTHEEFLKGVGVSACVYLLFILVGYIIPHIIRVPKDERRFYTIMSVYGNVGFLGIPVAKAILPENAMLYVIICNVFYCLLFYTHGVTALSSGKEKMNPKKLLSPGVLMSILALVIFWFDLKLPEIVVRTVDYIGCPTVFLSMILLGASVARSNIIREMKSLPLWLYIAVRMVLVPVVTVLVLKGIGAPADMVRTFCLMCAVPVGNLPMIQAEKTGERTDVLSRGIIVTTVFSFLSITVLMSVV